MKKDKPKDSILDEYSMDAGIFKLHFNTYWINIKKFYDAKKYTWN